mgnify:CR=1 FL=1
MMKENSFSKHVKKFTFLSLLLFCALSLSIPKTSQAEASSSDVICGAYLTGIGCSNCAVIDPMLFHEIVTKYPQAIILEYEIYHASKENEQIKADYFKNFFPGQPIGVPAFILNNTTKAVGRIKVADLLSGFDKIVSNACPMSDGTVKDLQTLDLTTLSGKINIWTKNRVLSTDRAGGDNRILKELLLETNIWKVLKGIPYEKIEPVPVEISQNVITFQYAVRIGSWTLQWNEYAPGSPQNSSRKVGGAIVQIFLALVGILVLVALLKIEKTSKGYGLRMRNFGKKQKDYAFVALAVVGLGAFFIFAKSLNPAALEKAGYYLPLPIFTLIIGFIDGFNPCNMFVLTCLMALLVSSSDSKMRLYVVGITFVGTVFVLYFLFMAAWLNVFQYVNFITPLRIGIGLLSLIAGLINCKELLFFKKGISLTIPNEQKGPLMKKIYAMKAAIQKGSFPVLISSAFALAILSSLVEIPCTAGFPIIYTGILSGKVFENSFVYYVYLAFYNILYVLPLFVIVTMFIVTFKGAPISQRQMEILKFIGGIIMILLGIVLLVNPSLVGVNMG